MRAFIKNDNAFDSIRMLSRLIVGIIILIFVVYCIVPLLLADKPLLAIDKYYFTGNTADNKRGYIIKANTFFTHYVSEKSINKDLINKNKGGTVFSYDSTLQFYIPADGDLGGIRLIDVKHLKDNDDILFYNNSLLREHLKIQAANPEKEIFKFIWEKGEDNTLNRIEIDKHILSVSLVSDNNFWRHSVLASTDSLFNGFIFAKLGHIWLPLGNLNKPDSADNWQPYGVAEDEVLDYLKSKDQYKVAKEALLQHKRVYQVLMGENSSVELKKIGDSLYLFCQGMRDIEFKNNKGRIKYPVRTGGGKYSRKIDSDVFEITFTDEEGAIAGTVYFTNVNPFNQLSYFVHHNASDFRYAVGTDKADVYSMIVAREVPNIENMFSPVGGEKGAEDFKVTNNPILGKYLEEEMKAYINASSFLKAFDDPEGRTSIRMATTIMNTTDAAVLAASWHSRKIAETKEYKNLVNFNFINQPIGSCFKPLLYFASFRRYPALSLLKLQPGMVSSFEDFSKTTKENKMKDVTLMGYPTRHFWGDTKGTGEDLNAAMAFSSNLFPAITFLYSLTENNEHYYTQLQGNTPLPQKLYTGPGTEHSGASRVIDNKLYMNGLYKNQIPLFYKEIFDVEEIDITKGDRDLYDYAYWDREYDAVTARPEQKLVNYGGISPLKVSLHFDAFNGRNKDDKKGNFRDDMVPWILGSQSNYWNTTKLCEAFTRVVTGIRNKGHIQYKDPRVRDTSIFSYTGNLMDRTAYKDTGDFMGAHLLLLKSMNNETHISGSTWREVGVKLKEVKIEGISTPFVILAKTGTADDVHGRNKKTVHRGAFMFTIMSLRQYQMLEAFIRSGYNMNKRPPKLGITGVISLELMDNQKDTELFYSKYARQFLENEQRLKELILLNRSLFL